MPSSSTSLIKYCFLSNANEEFPLRRICISDSILGSSIIVFIFVIAAIVQMIEMVLKKFIPGLYSALGIYLPLVTTNCAVLGVAQYVTVMAAEKAVTDLFGAVLYGFAGGLGFLLAIVLLSGIREKLDKLNIPKALKGFPITMIAACFMSMAFSVFIGIKF
ncbi:MAG: Rnf-Nqr domain containing protein [Clostridia bacterium]